VRDAVAVTSVSVRHTSVAGMAAAASAASVAASSSGALVAPASSSSSAVGPSAGPASTAAVVVVSPYVAPSYPWRQVLPVVAGAGLLLGGGLAYGIRHGGKQAAKAEEYGAEYEVKPQPEKEIEITPEMRRLAVRRAFAAFGLGTALCVAVGIGSSYAICTHWQVYSVRELSLKLGEVCVQKKEQLMAPFGDALPDYTRRTKSWFAGTALGKYLHVAPPPPAGAATGHPQLSAAEEHELDLLAAETERMEREWEDSWNGKAKAKQEADKAQNKPKP